MVALPTLRPEGLLVATFAALVLGGTVVLRMPVCHAGPAIGWIDCLFTSASAVCVTGLITVDTATAWSRTGQVVILVLIQLGGLGIMTFAAAAFQVFQYRISLRSQAALEDSLLQPESRMRLRTTFRRIVVTTLVIEAIGTAVIYVGTRRLGDAAGGWFEAVFHSISAFCNAGFSTNSTNVVGWRDSWLLMWTLMILITLGGLGYAVLHEILDRTVSWIRRRRHSPVPWSLGARVVLAASAVLTVGGAIVLGVCGLTRDEDTWGERLLHSLFQSVTARTAGFNTVAIEHLPVVSLLVLCALMYIGGSPGSTAGGIKTTSAVVAVANAASGVLGRPNVSLFGRRIPADVLQRTVLVIALATIWQAIGIFVLTLTENVPDGARFEQVIFEQVSAFNTVGLTDDLTPRLSVAGKLWIALSMFVGRVGPLTLGLAVLRRPARHFEYPVERVMVG